MQVYTHLDLFSGIGGFALAAQWAGIQTVGFCEIEEFPRKVLAKNFPGIPIHKDIRELDGKKYRKVWLITGGYPCQPYSVAGTQRAHRDDRFLWPEMFRVIKEAKPTWVVGENVYGHIKLGLDEVLADLESIGYSAIPFVIPAVASGADHQRQRVFIVAHTTSYGRNGSKIPKWYAEAHERATQGTNKSKRIKGRSSLRIEMERYCKTDWQGRVEPPAMRVDDGLPDRMDRIKALGNAVVPQVVYEILVSLKNI